MVLFWVSFGQENVGWMAEIAYLEQSRFVADISDETICYCCCREF